MTIVIPLGLVVASLAGLVLVGLAWRAERSGPPPSWSRRALVRDTLVYVFAANLVFLGQELALVTAKALLPGVEVTLFHNSHAWRGDHPDLDVAQGAGVIGLLVVAGLGWVLARRSRPGSFAASAGWWAVFHGAVGVAVVVASGVASPDTEAGQALAATGLTGSGAVIIGVLAVLAVPLVGLQLGPLLAPSPVGDGVTPFRTAQRRVLLPALLAVPVLGVFRLPSVEQALGGALVLAVAAPWATLGAAAAPLPSRSAADRRRAAEHWSPALLATGASLVVAVVLAPGLRFG